MKVLYHVQKQRRDEDEAVDAIEDAAVAGDAGAHVFDADIALDDADAQIAQLPAHADDQSRQYQLDPGLKWGNENQSNHGTIMEKPAADGATPGFSRADIAAQRAASEQFSAGESRDVI